MLVLADCFFALNRARIFGFSRNGHRCQPNDEEEHMAEKKVRKKKVEKEKLAFVQGFEGGTLKDIRLDKLDLEFNDLEFRVAPRVGDLVEDIGRNGQQFPIIVRGIAETYTYQIVSGYRRVRAIKALGWDTVKAIVRDDLDDDAAYRVSFLENEKRKNLTGVDKAHAISRLELMGKTAGQIQEIYGIKDRQYKRYKKVGTFPKVLKDAISDGTIQTTHGLLLAQAHEQHGDKVDLKALVEQIAEGELTVRQLARLLKKEKLGRVAKKARYFEKKGGGFRLYPMRFDPKTTDEATKAKLLEVLKEAVGVLEKKE
jgi:ParB/RepB/Spo0J family partition protein